MQWPFHPLQEPRNSYLQKVWMKLRRAEPNITGVGTWPLEVWDTAGVHRVGGRSGARDQLPPTPPHSSAHLGVQEF